MTQATSDIDGVDPAQRLHNLPALVAALSSKNPNMQLESTATIRRLLSTENHPPIKQVIAAGVVPRFVQFLAFHDHPQLQFEAAWALTNIASGSHNQTRIIIESGAVPTFVQLLSSPNDEVREQAVWALGNIAGDSPQSRDVVLSSGAMRPLLRNLMESSRLTMLRNATWALSNFCRGKPAPAFELVSPALGTLARLIISSTDEDVLADACWALSYLSDGEDNDKIQEVIQAGVSRRLVELLMHGSYNVKTPALRTVGNILAGDDIQTQIVLNVGALPCLLSLLSSPKKPIQKEVCWALSNITAGNKRQIQAVIDANFFPPLIHLLATGEFNIKKEIVWVLSNAAVGGTFLNAKYLVDLGCIKPLCDLLLASDVRLIRTVLETLENILSLGENEAMQLCANPFVEAVEEADALDKLEQLQMHDNIEIYQLAVNLLEKYFGGEEDQNVAFTPAIDPASQNFMFGTSQSQSQSSAGGFDLHMDS